ncbi:transglutaminase family protein [Acidocella aminolytica]|jgi:transglutaminase-like putative cysteine protease|uniref:Transglutaminase n=1 Tax=Acidocella aminolytica 101 = DSM 11237 TaxID=1120923 RepID=A0A0D6PI98_9PROT|nr:transglutaminase family protein [Acidocella aminolytica]GAN81500.1 transglutaminase [Acidocella aminolytica 101 = DSM 11237]GBQ33988.1 transglutaminase-like enzyme [Acidocella aminolytica 101 = DSM 11237]SHF02786.1 Transglutaminase-like enzyme, putative cysteine protease [Acidocella aminolytica 101 = DSM 11237]
MTLYRLNHATTYDYTEPVVIGTHFMHLLPRERPGQIVREAQLDIAPGPDNRRDEIDHFGNRTTSVSLTGAHKQFSVTLSATVEVNQPLPPHASQTPRWEAIAAWAQQEPEVVEFCLPSKLAAPGGGVADYAAVTFRPGRYILEALLELNQRIFTEMSYRPGVTNNFTTALHILHTRTGVCQDYAHFMLACLRALGLPGRYVSGYLRTLPPPGQEKRRGADQSHAWVSAWAGPDIGWVDFDPTNNLMATDEHVTLAWGRDFTDVSPLRGVILGGGRHILTVGVDLEPVLT